MNFKTNLRASNTLIDLTPLVDVIFLLLVFFVITSDILPLKSLNVENPKINKDSPPMTTQLLVVMDAQNVIYLGPKKDIVDLASLKEHLMEEIALVKKQRSGVDPTIVLSIDRRVEYGPFLRLFSTTQECSAKVRLVYKPSEDDEQEYFDTVGR
ncbi:MAG: biopolymer transport protein ExbD [Chlamydiales bacterium]|jgi:biopolymer transport protein ExbD